jgi:hypothetical protein
MRKRILRTVLPLMAFLIAAAFAIASDQKPSEGDVPVTGYIFENNKCTSVPMDCNNIVGTLCTYDGRQVYRDNYGTFCRTELYHQPF